MILIFFILYSVICGASLLTESSELYFVVGILTGAAIFCAFFQGYFLQPGKGYYQKKYLASLSSLAAIVPYLLFSHRIAAVICAVFMTVWLYAIPVARLLILRLIYTNAVKRACLERNHTFERIKGGMLVRTPGCVYVVHVVCVLRRMEAIRLVDKEIYTLRRISPTTAADPAFMEDLLGTQAGAASLYRRLIVGRERTRHIVWPAKGERVLLFLPGLCTWKFDGEQTLTNGSVRHGVAFYEANAFAERLTR